MSEISVVVVGSTAINSVVGNGDTVNVSVGGSSGGGSGAAATVQVGQVLTVDATQSASVVNSGTAYAAKLDFSIPRGGTGLTGPATTLSIGSVTTGTTAAVSLTGTAPSQQISFVLQPGPTGPANSLSIGSVSTGATAAVSISGAAPSQTLSFVLPQGPQGPQGQPNSLSIGSVTTGTTAAVSLTGTAPSQQISFVLQPGPKGDTGSVGPQGPSGSVNLADETPQPLGVASPGTALAAARADHIHAVPVISYGNLTGVPSEFAPAAHSQAISTITDLQAALDSKQAAGSYVTLVNNLIPSSFLPSYVDDVVDVGGTLPGTGEVGKIYVVSTGTNVNKIYRWSGSTFIEISASPGSTDAVVEGSTNLYFTTLRAAAAAPVQSVAGRTGTVTLTTADISGLQASLDSKLSTAVTSLNSLTGGVTIAAGANVTLSSSGSTITIASAAGGLGANDAVDGGTYVGQVIYQNTITITQQPANQTASGGSATFTVAATVSPSGTPTYQWQRSNNAGSSWANIAGQTSTSLSLTNLTPEADNDSRFRVVVSATGAAAVTSNSATLTVPYVDPFASLVELLIVAEGQSGSNAFVDSSSRARAITTAGNSVLSATQARFGSTSIYFDGSGDYLGLAPSAGFSFGTGDFCIEYFVFPVSLSATGDTPRLFGLTTAGGATQFDFCVGPAGKIIVWNGSAVIVDTNTGIVPASQWTHLAFARSSGVLRVYANGAKVADVSDTSNYVNSEFVLIGVTVEYPYGAATFMDGIRVTKGSSRGYSGATITVPSGASFVS